MADDLSTWVLGLSTLALVIVTIYYAMTTQRLLREQAKLRRLQAEALFYPDVHIHTPQHSKEHDKFWVRVNSRSGGYMRGLSLKAVSGGLTRVINEGDPARRGYHPEDEPERHNFEYDLTDVAKTAAASTTPNLLVEVTYYSVTGGFYRLVREIRGLRLGPLGGVIHEIAVRMQGDDPLESLAA